MTRGIFHDTWGRLAKKRDRLGRGDPLASLLSVWYAGTMARGCTAGRLLTARCYGARSEAFTANYLNILKSPQAGQDARAE